MRDDYMANDSIAVSICCLAYNHERYIRRCLDSFIMQETTFAYEILIHDDASTDGTASIIREYEEKYPDIIKPIYQKNNQYSQGVKISFVYQYPRARGKYIALCEGDDYWIDKHKLQKQYEALEDNIDCQICLHKVENVTESEESIGSFYPRDSLKSGVISQEQFIQFACSYSFQTSSYFFRVLPTSIITNMPSFMSVAGIGDTPLMLLNGSIGKAYYINETMSCYRHNSICGWNSIREKWNIDQNIMHLDNVIKLFEEFNEFTNHKYSSQIDYAIFCVMIKKCNYTNCYRELLQYKYRKEFKKFNTKEKVYYFLLAFFPVINKLHKTSKKGKHDK